LTFELLAILGSGEGTDMLPRELLEGLQARIASTDHPRELAVDVMLASQNHYGYLSDEALEETAQLLGMTSLELEELATFYDFIYREPVGRFVIHVCDGVVCWMNGYGSVLDYLVRKLGIKPGETTADGSFTLLPTACIGYCDLSPAMLINGRAYGPLTPEKIDDILNRLSAEPPKPRMAR
jgi:NADH-quinone oxidoreductase subunit E